MKQSYTTQHRKIGVFLGVSSVRSVLVLFVVGLCSFFVVNNVLAWSSPGYVDGFDEEGMWPDVALDDKGYVHVVWSMLDGTAYYSRGRLNDSNSGIISWEQRHRFSKKVKGNSIRIVVSNDGTLHVAVVTTDSDLYYYYSTSNGSSWNSENVGECSWNASIAVDTENTPYVACAKGFGDNDSRILFSYRKGSGSWRDMKTVSKEYYLTRKTHIAVYGAGDSAIVHISYEIIEDEGDKEQAFYSRGTRNGGFSYSNLSSSFGYSKGYNPSIAVDPATGYVYSSFVWGGISDGFSSLLVYSTNQGQDWAKIGNMLTDEDLWSDLQDINAINNMVYVLIYAKKWDGKGIDSSFMQYYTYNEGTKTLSSGQKISTESKATNGHLDVGNTAKVAVWVEGNMDGTRYAIDPGGSGGSVVTPVPTATATPTGPTPTPLPTSTPLPTPTPTPLPGPRGALQINNDEDIATNTSALVTFVLQSGRADQYKVWNDGASEPASFTALTTPLNGSGAYVAPLTLPFNDPPGQSACAIKIVYGRLHDTVTGISSDPMFDTILVDPGVDAQVSVSNPGSGDAAYTNTPYYVLDVQSRSGECSWLSSVQVGENVSGQLADTADNATILDASTAATSNLMPMVSSEPGVHTVVVHVTDGVGHTYTYEENITLDTSSPQVTSETASFTMVDKQSGAATTQADSILVDLQATDLNIQEELGNGQSGEVWGLWLANSTQSIPISHTTSLDALSWTPVRVYNMTVKDDIYDFTVGWNLFTGLTESERKAGDIYVYARVMDAAGNMSTETLGGQQITLLEGYSLPTVYLPMVLR